MGLSKIVDIFRKDCSCRRAADAMQTEAQKGYEYSTSSATYAVKPGGTDRIMADFRHLREHLWRFSLPIELFLPSALPVCRHRSSVQAVQRDRDECIALTDRPYLLSRKKNCFRKEKRARIFSPLHSLPLIKTDMRYTVTHQTTQV